jgi:thiamine-phosphate pyrophosphorylase
MPWNFPKIYPILDSSVLPAAGRPAFLLRLGATLAEAGVTLLEYRNKTGSGTEVLNDAAILRAAMPGPEVKLILDDRAELVERLGFDGVHVDAGDLSPAQARQLIDPGKIVGAFGGCEALLPGVLNEPVDYWSIGPVFATTTKETSKPLIGIEGVRRLRAQAGPEPRLVAAAGITLDTAAAVLAAGASAVAVSAAIFRTADPAAEFRRWIAAIG